ncbi:MAG: GxxExxY protein [Chlamydiales bacterium]|nr:GxxExxY protein [Chlamydiales bacterium]
MRNFTTENTESAEKGLTKTIIGAAIEVHRHLGPGLLESTYENCLVYELRSQKIKVEQQKMQSVSYKHRRLDCGYRLDLLVEDRVIIEVKSVSALEAIHEAQLLSYLKLSKCKVGLLINFNVKLLIKGIKRFIL